MCYSPLLCTLCQLSCGNLSFRGKLRSLFSVGKILNVVDKIAPFKVLRIKNNTQDWFDDEVAKAIKGVIHLVGTQHFPRY